MRRQEQQDEAECEEGDTTGEIGEKVDGIELEANLGLECDMTD